MVIGILNMSATLTPKASLISARANGPGSWANPAIALKARLILHRIT
jgi:hypothetical protein